MRVSCQIKPRDLDPYMDRLKGWKPHKAVTIEDVSSVCAGVHDRLPR
jgi:hypothetical protein